MKQRRARARRTEKSLPHVYRRSDGAESRRQARRGAFSYRVGSTTRACVLADLRADSRISVTIMLFSSDDKRVRLCRPRTTAMQVRDRIVLVGRPFRRA